MREEARLMATPAAWFAFGFGAGLSPLAPGTCGTLAAIPFYLLLVLLPWPYYAVSVAALFVIGVWASERMVRALGRQDPQAVVADEMVGFWITMFAAPAVHWTWILLGFGLFRLFDIAKPWPIGHLDRVVKGGLGTMLDDALAGVYAALVMAGVAWWVGAYGGVGV